MKIRNSSDAKKMLGHAKQYYQIIDLLPNISFAQRGALTELLYKVVKYFAFGMLDLLLIVKTTFS